jgi:hypothetical protein
MEKCIPGNLVGHGKTHWEVRRPIALRRGKIRLKRAQVAEVSPMSRLCRLCRVCVAYVAFASPMSRASRERRVYRASVALHAWYCRLDLCCNICHCEATQDRVSTPFAVVNHGC